MFYLIDVGGGNTEDDAPNSLSYIPLRWMIKEILEANTGIIFKDDPRLAKLGIILHPDSKQNAAHPHSGGDELYTPIPPSTSADALITHGDDVVQSPYLVPNADEADVLESINDELVHPMWWLLEFYPFLRSKQDKDDVWHNYVA